MSTKAKYDEAEPVYYCIWTDDKIVCKVRTAYKLKPESLILFCRFCTELPLNKKFQKKYA